MDNPQATPQLKTLGKVAQSMAASQGGKLTEEQANLLTKEAKEILGAQPSTLTDAGKQVLEAFITQLEEFPKAEDDAKAPDSATRSATTTPQEKGGSAKAKADLENLVMDDLGLGDDVQQLGQQALRYVQGNNGKLSEKESEQLKEAAEALIQGGADGDDLKALQNFLRTLLTFPKGAPGFESPLALTQPNIDPKMITLAQYATAMLKGQNGTLTQQEANMLKSMAEELMAQLSPDDQAVLAGWLGKLGMVPVAKPPPIQQFNPAHLFHPNAPKDNPFLKPGIMAMLAPILSEILAINNDIIRQSSKLKQSMMKLLAAMADEAFKFAMAAGQARANQLLNEAAMHMALGISSVVQAAMTIGAFGMQKGAEMKVDKKLNSMNSARRMNDWAKEKPPGSDKGYTSRETALKEARADNKVIGHEEGSPEFAKMVDTHYNGGGTIFKKDGTIHRKVEVGSKTLDNNPEPMKADDFTGPPSFGEGLNTLSQKQQLMSEKGFTFLPTFLGQVGKATDEFIQYGFMTAKVKDVMEETAATAYKDMITQLMQLVTGTMQSASEEMQSAQKNFESFAQLYRDFANTITQSIYRSG